MSKGSYSAGQRQARQHGCVGIENEDAHIGRLAGQCKGSVPGRPACPCCSAPAEAARRRSPGRLRCWPVQGVEISLTPTPGCREPGTQ